MLFCWLLVLLKKYYSKCWCDLLFFSGCKEHKVMKCCNFPIYCCFLPVSWLKYNYATFLMEKERQIQPLEVCLVITNTSHYGVKVKGFLLRHISIMKPEKFFPGTLIYPDCILVTVSTVKAKQGRTLSG